jgi:predicted transcriptional regulator
VQERLARLHTFVIVASMVVLSIITMLTIMKPILYTNAEEPAVKVQAGRRTFKTTAKGIQFIFAHEQMQKFIVLKTTIPRQGPLK